MAAPQREILSSGRAWVDSLIETSAVAVPKG